MSEAAALKELVTLDPDLVRSNEPLPPALVKSTPNKKLRAPGTRIDTIVLHCTAGSSSAGALSRLQDPAAEASAHLVIPDDSVAGEPRKTTQLVPDEYEAWHCRKVLFQGTLGVNYRSLGIEIVNTAMAEDPYTAWQVAETARWCRYWIAKHPIRYLVTHAYLDPSRRRDPCATFPWLAFLNLVTHDSAPPVERSQPAIRLLVRGKEIAADPEVQDGTLKAALRPVVEALGFQIQFDTVTRIVTITS